MHDQSKETVALRSKMFWVLVFCANLGAEAVEEQSKSINKPVEGGRETWMQFSSDYVRCYCNLPACVTTGYMCKSRGGGCFSDLLDHSSSRSSVYRGRHGCVELLTDRDQKAWCENPENNARRPQKKNHPKSLLLCCKQDMCNHVENPQTRNILNDTLLEQILEDSTNENRIVTQNQEETFLYTDSEVWFRAATIAVPICGAVILVALIVLAVKILKSENENSPNRKLGPTMYFHHLPPPNKSGCEKHHHNHFDATYDHLLGKQFIHTHQNSLFLDQYNDQYQPVREPLLQIKEVNVHNFENKNQANAKMNLIPSEEVCEYLEKTPGSCPEVNIVKNITNKNVDSKFSNL